MKRNIREMVRLSIEDSERWRRGLGKESGTSPTTPERANRPGGNAVSAEDEELFQDLGPCRIVGFIPLFKGQ
jgi:hypothetical protein